MAFVEAKLITAVVLAVLLSMVGAWLIAYRYRAAMRRLMSAPLPPAASGAPSPGDAVPGAPPPRGSAGAGAGPSAGASAGAAGTTVSPLPAAPGVRPAEPRAAVSAADNRRAAWLLTGVLIGLSLLISASMASIAHLVMFHGEFSIRRVAILVVVQMWPVLPVLGIVWRWSRLRIVTLLAAWFVVAFGLALWRSITPDPTGILAFLAIEIGPPMLLIAALYFGNATRAIAPWLLPLMFGFAFASLVGGELLGFAVERHLDLLVRVTGGIGATPVFLLAFVLPWLLAWWPLRALGRALGRAYERKHVSELGMVLAAVWGLSMLYQWSGLSREGPAGALVLLPFGWIVAAAGWGTVWFRSAPRGPTLLVLRVFQHDAQVQNLFDTVIERWRVSGNTVLIAGTDLLERTLGADDIFAFLDGRLSTRFIAARADVAAHIAAFDWLRDHDGRYRVNECYCHDTTWQDALAALVERSDVVLMDLRGFKARNAGCAHELATLARAARIARVVVLVDAETDRAAADLASHGAPADRFVWVDTPRIDRRHAHRVLRQLFVPSRSAAANPGRA